MLTINHCKANRSTRLSMSVCVQTIATLVNIDLPEAFENGLIIPISMCLQSVQAWREECAFISFDKYPRIDPSIPSLGCRRQIQSRPKPKRKRFKNHTGSQRLIFCFWSRPFFSGFFGILWCLEGGVCECELGACCVNSVRNIHPLIIVGGFTQGCCKDIIINTNTLGEHVRGELYRELGGSKFETFSPWQCVAYGIQVLGCTDSPGEYEKP